MPHASSGDSQRSLRVRQADIESGKGDEEVKSSREQWNRLAARAWESVEDTSGESGNVRSCCQRMTELMEELGEEKGGDNERQGRERLR